MLKVTVELLPGGDHNNPKTLGIMYVTNVERLAGDRANYIVDHDEGSFILENHRRADGFWILIKNAILEMLL